MNLSTQELKTFDCVKCEEKFCSIFELGVHSWTHEERPKSSFPFECTICQRRFVHSKSLPRHLRTHETNPNLRLPFPCHICQKRFRNSSDLKTHLIIHETDPKWRYPFKCGICQKKFGYVTNLVSHFRNHEKVDKLRSSYSCGMGQCQKGFSTLAELKQHFKVCEEKYPYVCDVCSTRFSTPQELHIHSRIHVKSFDCRRCGLKFQEMNNLDEHMTVHLHTDNDPDSVSKNQFTHETNPNARLPFLCHICSKRFSSKSNLKIHLITHETDPKCRYPIKCGICQKKFSFAVNLVRHLRTHEKDDMLRSPYSCAIGQCQKRFSTKSELTQHLNTHEEVSVYLYSYVCDGCSRRFSTQQELHIHSRIHDKSFDCHRCGLKFQKKNHLAEHMRVHCPTDNDPDSVSKNQFTQLKRDTIVSKQSVPGPTLGKQFKYVDKSKIFFNNSNMNTQLMGQEAKPKSHTEGQFTQKNLKHNEVMSVGHYLCIQKNVCDDELSSEVSLKCRISELEPHSNLKSSVECNICKGCFVDSQFLVKHLQLVHGISSQFDLYSNKTGIQESTPMNEYLNNASNKYPLVHNVCSRRFSSEGYLKSPSSSSSRSPSKYEEEALLDAHIEPGKRFIQEEESSINSKEKNTKCQGQAGENPKSVEEQLDMKNNLKGGTVIQQNDLCIDEVTSGPSSRHQNTEPESNWNLNSSVEFNFEQRFHDTQSSVGHHGLVDSRSTLTELDLDQNKAELQDIKDFLKAEGFQFQ